MIRRRKPLTSTTGLARRTPLTRAARSTSTATGTPPRGSTLRSSGPIKPRPPAVSRAERDARGIVQARSNGWCEIRIPEICDGRAVDWCHRIARGRGGPWRASNGLAGCRACHSATTNTAGKRAEYVRLGWIVTNSADTLAVPVFLASWRGDRQWVLLADDGTVQLVEEAA